MVPKELALLPSEPRPPASTHRPVHGPSCSTARSSPRQCGSGRCASGEVNCMTAGSGYPSERFDACAARSGPLDCIPGGGAAGRTRGDGPGLHTTARLFRCSRDGVVGRLIAGSLAGVTSPVRVDSPHFYGTVTAPGRAGRCRPVPRRAVIRQGGYLRPAHSTPTAPCGAHRQPAVTILRWPTAVSGAAASRWAALHR